MTTNPQVYFISGSPPSWRVMLALSAKSISYDAVRLHTESKDNRSSEYLALNPRGQVPTFKMGDMVVRESIAILMMIERLWPNPSLVGPSDQTAAAAWSAVLDLENNLVKAAGEVARSCFRKQLEERAELVKQSAEIVHAELDRLQTTLANAPYLLGDELSLPDIYLYPTLAWVERALSTISTSTAAMYGLEFEFAGLDAWKGRIEALPNFAETVPPHWRAS